MVTLNEAQRELQAEAVSTSTGIQGLLNTALGIYTGIRDSKREDRALATALAQSSTNSGTLSNEAPASVFSGVSRQTLLIGGAVVVAAVLLLRK